MTINVHFTRIRDSLANIISGVANGQIAIPSDTDALVWRYGESPNAKYYIGATQKYYDEDSAAYIYPENTFGTITTTDDLRHFGDTNTKVSFTTHNISMYGNNVNCLNVNQYQSDAPNGFGVGCTSSGSLAILKSINGDPSTAINYNVGEDVAHSGTFTRSLTKPIIHLCDTGIIAAHSILYIANFGNSKICGHGYLSYSLENDSNDEYSACIRFGYYSSANYITRDYGSSSWSITNQAGYMCIAIDDTTNTLAIYNNHDSAAVISYNIFLKNMSF